MANLKKIKQFLLKDVNSIRYEKKSIYSISDFLTKFDHEIISSPGFLICKNWCNISFRSETIGNALVLTPF